MATNYFDRDHWEGKGDCLGRRPQAEMFTIFLLETYRRQQENNPNGNCSYVLNIDSEWGFGKTFFIDRWQESLEHLGHPTFRYDAWRNDYSQDALFSLMAELLGQLKALNGKHDSISAKTSELLEAGAKVAKQLAPHMIGATFVALSGLFLPGLIGGIAGFKDAAEKISEGLSESGKEVAVAALEGFLAEQSERGDSIKAFKELAASVIKKLADDEKIKLPLIVFVDELDRCRPNFAVEVIECIKHIFSINHVYFIFTTAGAQLNASVKNMYGSEFNAEIYFKRFFDRECHLARPSTIQFANMLVKRFGYEDYDRKNIILLPEPTDRKDAINPLAAAFSMVSIQAGLSLRDQEQVFESLDMFVKTQFDITKHPVMVWYALVLLIMHHSQKGLYQGFIGRRKAISEVVRMALPGDDQFMIGKMTETGRSVQKEIKIGTRDIFDTYHNIAVATANDYKEPENDGTPSYIYDHCCPINFSQNPT